MENVELVFYIVLPRDLDIEQSIVPESLLPSLTICCAQIVIVTLA